MKLRPLVTALACTLPLTLPTLASAQCVPNWMPLSSFSLGGFPFRLAAADLNADTLTDLVVSGPGPLRILLNNGSALSSPITIAPNGTTLGLLVADFNADTRPDIVLTSGNAGGQIIFYRAAGAPASFAAPVTFPAGAGPDALATGDINADAKPDLFVAGSGGISVLLGNGDGTFQPPVLTPVVGGISFLAAADFNLDGRTDLVAGQGVGTGVFIFRAAQGPGAAFAPSDFIPTAAGLSALTAGDLNLDGRPDIVSVEGSSSRVTVILAAGAPQPPGVFTPPAPFPLGAAAADAVFITNLGADTRPDVLTTGPVRALMGNGDGTLNAPLAGPSTSFGGRAVGRFNNDPVNDLAVTDTSGGSLTIYMNITASNFPAPAIVAQPASAAVPAGSTAAFTFDVNSQGNAIAYQWRKGGVNLASGPRIAGATSRTLTITSAQSADSDAYTCVATTLNCNLTPNTLTSAAAVLGVTGSSFPGCNVADVTGVGGPPELPDGQLTVDDLILFVNAFSEGCP